MRRKIIIFGVILFIWSVTLFYGSIGITQQRTPPEAVEDAQTPRPVESKRPEQQKTPHDQADVFSGSNAPPSSAVFGNQPDEGKALGFDFARDPFNAKLPMQSGDDIMKNDIAEKPKVTTAQQQLLTQRYDLNPRLDAAFKMSRGKPLAVGPTARLSGGANWQSLAQMTAEEVRKRNVFPYPSLPHPKHVAGGMVFPQAQIEMFPRLERFDVEFDIPEAFLPEFPPAIFLQNRPELGDVSRGEVVSINNFYRLFKDLLTPVQLDGLQFLVTPFPQEESIQPMIEKRGNRVSAFRVSIATLTVIRRVSFTLTRTTGAPASPLSARYYESTGNVRPANTWLQAEFALS